MEIGDIFIKKNITFKNSNQVDELYRAGRPCLLIAETNESYYFLTISHKKHYSSNYKLENQRNERVNGYINLENIYKTDTYYYKVVDRLTRKEYFKVMNKLFACQKLLNDDLYDELVENVKKKKGYF